MSHIRHDTKMTDQLERELISGEVNGFSLRMGRSSAPSASAGTAHPKAFTLLQSALIAGAVVFAAITIALQAAARFF